MTKRAFWSAEAATALAACATVSPQAQLRDDLVSLGLPRDDAACFAERLDDRLDGPQMRRFADRVSELARIDETTDSLDAVANLDFGGPDGTAMGLALAEATVSCALRYGFGAGR